MYPQMETTFKFRIDLEELNRVKEYAERHDLSGASVFKDGAKMLIAGGVPTKIISPAPPVEKVAAPVHSVVDELKAKFGGHVVSASELNVSGLISDKPKELPFGPSSAAESLKGTVSNPTHQRLVDRFISLLKKSTPDGIKQINTTLSQWEDMTMD